MTKLEELRADLSTHVASRQALINKEGKSYMLLARTGYPVVGVIESYDRIIASLEAEISGLEAKAAARKATKKTVAKKQTKKTTSKKKAK